MSVNVYVDRFYLYYRALAKTPHKWLNLHKLAKRTTELRRAYGHQMLYSLRGQNNQESYIINFMPRVVNKRLMTGAGLARSTAFVVRCSGAATLSYILATAISLPYPFWASISGIIISREKLFETHNSMAGRFFGTLIGTASTVVISSLLSPYDVGIAGQMAVPVAICAIIALTILL